MILNYTWWWGSSFGNLEECGVTLSLTLLPGPIGPRMLVHIKVPFMGQILFKDYQIEVITWNNIIVWFISFIWEHFKLDKLFVLGLFHIIVCKQRMIDK